MVHALRQAGFGLVVLYCLLRVYEMLWAQTTFGFMLPIVVAAALCYLGQRVFVAAEQGVHLSLGEQGVAALLVLMAVSLAAQHAFIGSNHDVEGVDSAAYTFTMTVNSVFWLLAGAAMSTRELRYSLVRALLILGIVLFILNSARGEDMLFVDYGQIIADSGLEGLSHLNVAEFVVVLVFVCYASVKRFRPLVFGVGVLAIFMLSGRSSLYLSIATVMGLQILQSGRRAVLGVAAGAIVLAALFYVALSAGMLDTDNRFVQQVLFVDGLEEDSSFQERQYISDNAWKYLPSQFLFGNPKIIVLEFDTIGSYLHNLLSAWQFFGFPVFIVLVGLLGASCLRMRAVLDRDASPLVVFGSLLLIYTVLSVILTKFVGFRLLWLSIGFWMLQPGLAMMRHFEPVKLRKRRRRRSNRPRSLVGKLRRKVGV